VTSVTCVLQIIPSDPLGGSLFQEGTMSRKMQIRLGGLGTAVLASLAFAPMAQALPEGQMVNPSSGTGVAPVRSEFLQPSIGYGIPAPPDRVDRIGGATQITAGVVAPPDRADRLGTVGGARAVPTSVVLTSDSGFNWTDAMLGAVAALAAVLLAGLGVMMTRRHGGVAQPS
jgi:hypothetical protein